MCSFLNHSTVNTGSYFKTLFSGKTVAISFDVSEMVNPVSRLGPVVCLRLASYLPPGLHRYRKSIGRSTMGR